MRSGSHGSVAGSMPEAAATALPTTVRGNGKSTLAQMPNAFDSRCVSQRSIPRVGTAMTSRANGSGGGSANRPRRASIRPSARSDRWTWSMGSLRESRRGRQT